MLVSFQPVFIDIYQVYENHKENEALSHASMLLVYWKAPDAAKAIVVLQ